MEQTTGIPGDAVKARPGLDRRIRRYWTRRSDAFGQVRREELQSDMDFCASLVDNPATFRIFVVKKNVQHLCGCEAVRRVVCFVVIGNFLK